MKKKYGKLKHLIFFMILPTIISIKLGSLRLTPCRIILIINFIQACSKVYSGKCNGKDKVDICMMIFSLWCLISFYINHGMETAIESGGVLVLETVTPFLMARMLLISRVDFEIIVNLLKKIVIFSLVILIPESITGINFFGKVVYPMMGSSYVNSIDQRYGFTRARGSFDHPIISGVFCSAMIGFAWFSVKKNKIRNTVLMVIATVTSLSSGAIASIMTQFLIIGWEIFSRKMRKRWAKLIFLIVFSYFAIDLISNRSGIKVIISYLTFSPATAYWRTIIWDYGIITAQNNPFFGIGFHDWDRPSWMHSGSMDNFFLVIMVRHGFPAFGFLAFSIYSIARRLLLLNIIDENLKNIRRGWLTGLVGLCISACTVHYWNQAYIFFMFYLGFGLALLKLTESNYEK